MIGSFICFDFKRITANGTKFALLGNNLITFYILKENWCLTLRTKFYFLFFSSKFNFNSWECTSILSTLTKNKSLLSSLEDKAAVFVG